MEISIQKNDAFRLMSSASGYPENILEEIIIKRLIDEGMMTGDTIDCGLSIQQIAVENKYNALEIVKVLFPEGTKNMEVIELMDSIYIFGTADDNPCPKCGCECEGTEDGADGHVWTEWKCSNSECDFADTNEPDFDVLPGGYAYNSEN